MKTINIYAIDSVLRHGLGIDNKINLLLNEINSYIGVNFSLCELNDLYNANLSLILIKSGGSENQFLKNISLLKEPYYLLTFGENNSLAASLEIMAYLKNHNLKGEILHGNPKYIAERISHLLGENV